MPDSHYRVYPNRTVLAKIFYFLHDSLLHNSSYHGGSITQPAQGPILQIRFEELTLYSFGNWPTWTVPN